MADISSAPVNSAAQQPQSVPPDALPKNPFADLKADKADKAPDKTSTPDATEAQSVNAEAQKPEETPASNANGDTAVNGAAKTSAAESGPSAEEPSTVAAGESATTKTDDAGDAHGSSTEVAQPPVMTGALPLGDKQDTATSKPSESTEADGVKDITDGTAAPDTSAPNGVTTQDSPAVKTDAPTEPVSTGKSDAETVEDKKDATPTIPTPTAEPSASADKTTGTNLEEKKDVEMAEAAPSTDPDSAAKPSTTESTEKTDVDMPDAAPASQTAEPAVAASAAPTATSTDKKDDVIEAAPASAPVAAADTADAAPQAAAPPATSGKKRKADDAADVNGAEKAEEPAAKKQKGTFARAVAKAKEAVHDVKDKASAKRKAAKEKKERPPVGRTERKTRSQGRAE